MIMPPTIGTAIRCMPSELVPVPNVIGNKPAMITATFIVFRKIARD